MFASNVYTLYPTEFRVLLWSYLPYIFLLVLLSDGDITTIRLEFMLWELPKGIVLYTERVIKYWSDVILPAHNTSK